MRIDNESNKYIPATIMMMYPSPPAKGTISPKSSPRASPKSGVRLFGSKSNNFRSLLLGLIAFSSITNLLFWRQNVGGVHDNSKRMDGDWDTMPREKESDQKNHGSIDNWQRQYSRNRKTNDSRDGKRNDGRIIDQQHQRLHKQHHTKSTIRRAKIPVEVSSTVTPKINEVTVVHDSSILSNENDELISDVDHRIRRNKLHFAFRPHPIKKEGRVLLLPKISQVIKHQHSVFLDGNLDISIDESSFNLVDLPTNNTDKSFKSSEDGNQVQRSQTVVWDDDEQCVPMSDWQTTVHPSCNSLHELDLALLINDAALSLVSSKGYWRNAWKVDLEIFEENDIIGFSTPWSRLNSSLKKDTTAATSHVVLKSLKYIHEPNSEIFELNRVDAISLDVLTKSHFTVNIYGFCGHASIQEFAGGDLKSLLPKLDPIDKLRVATWLANGVADIHSVDSSNALGEILKEVNNDDTVKDDSSKEEENIDGNEDHRFISTNKTEIPVSLIHNDINMDNILLGYRNGVEVPLINDFNIAVFRKKDARTGSPCLFHGRFANPQWMSPEQQSRPEDELSTGKLNEKIDIYALGNIFYKIAVGNSPWKYDYQVKKITAYEKGKIARAKLRGAKPKVPPEIRNNSTSPIKAILTAMNKCYRNDAKLRPSAKEIANYLQSELDAIELPLKVMDRFEFDV